MTDYGDELTKPNDSHTYHHFDRTPTFNFKVEKNSRSVNWSITVENVLSEDEAKKVYDKARKVVDDIIKSEMAAE